MAQPIKLILLMNNQILVSQIEEVPSELGEPDCKLIKPYIVNQSSTTLSPWISDFSSEDTFMIHSDKIMTLADPKPTLLEKYQNLTK
jgi:hypothetical protein